LSEYLSILSIKQLLDFFSFLHAVRLVHYSS
jgi:hypothetical protein